MTEKSDCCHVSSGTDMGANRSYAHRCMAMESTPWMCSGKNKSLLNPWGFFMYHFYRGWRSKLMRPPKQIWKEDVLQDSWLSVLQF